MKGLLNCKIGKAGNKEMPTTKGWQEILEGEEKALISSARRSDFVESNRARWREIVTKDFSLNLDFFQGKKVLEIGGGTYGMLPVLDNAFLRVGIDPLSDRFEAFYLKYDPQRQIRRVSGIGEELPFDNSTFDVVIVCNVLRHTLDPGKIIRGSYRVLSNGGLLLFQDISFDRLPKLVRTHLKLIDRQHPFHFNEKELEGFLREARFKITYHHAVRKDTLQSVLQRFKAHRYLGGIILFFALLVGTKNCHYIGQKQTNDTNAGLY